MATPTSQTGRSVHFCGLVFTLKPLPAIFLLVFVPLFCSLGIWQTHRAQEKSLLLAELADRQHQAPLSIRDVTTPNTQRYFPIKARGRLENGASLLVQNKYYNHHIGYVVLTPLTLQDGSVVLLNRGWVAQHNTDKIGHTRQNTIVTGIVIAPAQKIFQLGDVSDQANGYALVQNASWHEITRVMGKAPLKPFMIVTDPSSPLSFTPIFTPTIMPPAKHIGYAVQWFAMALAVLGIFIWQCVGLSSRRHDPQNDG